MKKILSLFVFIFLLSISFVSVEKTFAATAIIGVSNNINIGWSAGNESNAARNNDKLQDFDENNQFIKVTTWWEKGLFNTLIRFARDLKNLFYAIATIYFLVIALKLIFASNTEEELWKFKKWIIWITVGLIVMQLAFAFAKIMFDQGVSARLGASLLEHMVWPIILLIQTLASIFFIAMAIFAFYSLVTANGNEEAIKKGKTTILHALIGFMIVRFARGLVEAFYGHIDCGSFALWFITVEGENCINTVDISEWTGIIITILNWFNGFVAIAVLLMIIYAGAQILLSAGDEEKIKKWKTSIIYIAIWLGILALNYLILTFFLAPESII